MAVLMVENEKGEFVEVPFFTASGDGEGGGGGSAGYEQVYSYNSGMGAFEGSTITGETAQKLADANEIYVLVNTFGATSIASTIKVSFHFSTMFSHQVRLRLDADPDGVDFKSRDWLVKLEKMSNQYYVAEETLFNHTNFKETDGFPTVVEQVSPFKKYMIAQYLPSGELPSFTISVVSQEDETQVLSLPNGGYFTIWAR